MKNLVILLSIIFLLGSCKNQSDTSESGTEAAITLTLEEFFNNPHEYMNKEITITGLVTHVCKHGGQKLFIAGREDNSSVRIEVGKDITEFDTNMEGTEAEFTGIVMIMDQEFEENVKAEEKEHHPETEGEDDCAFEDNAKNYYIVASTFKSL